MVLLSMCCHGVGGELRHAIPPRHNRPACLFVVLLGRGGRWRDAVAPRLAVEIEEQADAAGMWCGGTRHSQRVSRAVVS